ncbi:MAG TPA: patatin-like phospholipase family protein [Thermoanaerobaculia bacterium]|nr:patatin-like phospholipase family protein [Thermoanaerobaculia bacterium]
MAQGWDRYRKGSALVNGLKYSLFFALLLVLLPLASFRPIGGGVSALASGLFHELSWLAVGGVSLFGFLAAWSLMIATNLTVRGIEARAYGPRAPETAGSPEAKALPKIATRFFAFPLTWGQFLLFTALGLPNALVVAASSRSPGWAAFPAALAGAVAAYLLTVLMLVPVKLAEPSFDPLPNSLLARAAWGLASRSRTLTRLALALRGGLSRLFDRLGLEWILQPGAGGRKVLVPDHFLGTVHFLLLVVAIVLCGVYFDPPYHEHWPGVPTAAAFLWMLITLWIWVLQALDYHLSRFRLSPILLLLLWTSLVYSTGRADHFYPLASVHPASASDQRLSPELAATAGGPRENLIVVTSSGGGILAGAWTTHALAELARERPQLPGEIRLLSTVSGGSTGAAFSLAALAELDGQGATSPERRQKQLELASKWSRQSALGSISYGFVMLDFWRFFVGNLFSERDRGSLEDGAWQSFANGRDWTFESLEPMIRDGRLPAFIFNSTEMETGQRMMLTPLEFPGPSEAGYRARGATLSEMLFRQEPQAPRANLSLWTAARLSATFPFVSPAARAPRVVVAGDGRRIEPVGYHLLDGGYFDNDGIASALDWLGPVLAARREAQCSAGSAPGCFRRVLILELNAFVPSSPPKAASGSLSARVGPLLGAVSVRSGAAKNRNQIELEAFLEAWKERLGQQVELCTVTLQPSEDGGEEPLSWRLTDPQQKEMEKRFRSSEVQGQKARALEFLAGRGCGDSVCAD